MKQGDLLQIIKESMALDEKVNPDNDEVNAIIRKYLKRKGTPTAKEQAILDKYGITYDNYHKIFTGPNGEELRWEGYDANYVGDQGIFKPVSASSRGNYFSKNRDNFEKVDYANMLNKKHYADDDDMQTYWDPFEGKIRSKNKRAYNDDKNRIETLKNWAARTKKMLDYNMQRYEKAVEEDDQLNMDIYSERIDNELKDLDQYQKEIDYIMMFARQEHANRMSKSKNESFHTRRKRVNESAGLDYKDDGQYGLEVDKVYQVDYNEDGNPAELKYISKEKDGPFNIFKFRPMNSVAEEVAKVDAEEEGFEYDGYLYMDDDTLYYTFFDGEEDDLDESCRRRKGRTLKEGLFDRSNRVLLVTGPGEGALKKFARLLNYPIYIHPASVEEHAQHLDDPNLRGDVILDDIDRYPPEVMSAVLQIIMNANKVLAICKDPNKLDQAIISRFYVKNLKESMSAGKPFKNDKERAAYKKKMRKLYGNTEAEHAKLEKELGKGSRLKEEYSLVGQNGNAFSLMGYTARCMKECGISRDEIDKMYEEATSGDYDNLLIVCDDYIQRCNAIAEEEGLFECADMNEEWTISEKELTNKIVDLLKKAEAEGLSDHEAAIEIADELEKYLKQNNQNPFAQKQESGWDKISKIL